MGSRVFSEAEVWEWTTQIQEAKAGRSAACVCAVTVEDEVERLCAVIAESKSSSVASSSGSAGVLPEMLQGPTGLGEPTTIIWIIHHRKPG